MKPSVVAAFLLVGLLTCEAMPSSRVSCYKKVLKDRNCHNVANGVDLMRPVDSLQNHFWEGNRCDMVCYCNFSELLCCPRLGGGGTAEGLNNTPDASIQIY
ncbi:hypothetical protein JZ751_012658, partial [Albula glossodonta]